MPRILSALRKRERPSTETRPENGSEASAPGLFVERSGKTTFLPLSAGRQRVGGGHDCDLILFGISPAIAFHVMLFEDGSATLEALSEDISADGRPIMPGETVAISNGSPLRIGDVECYAQGLRGEVRARLSRRRIAAALLLALACGLLIAGMEPDEPPNAVTITIPPRDENAQATVTAIVAELVEAIRLAGLDIKVDAAAATEIRLGEGSPPLDATGEVRLASIISAVRRRSPVPIIDATTLTSGLKDFVAAAGFEPVKFIVGKDGKRYREGDALSNGWRVSEIAGDHIVVARGGKTDMVRFTGNSPDLGLTLAQMRAGKGL